MFLGVGGNKNIQMTFSVIGLRQCEGFNDGRIAVVPLGEAEGIPEDPVTPDQDPTPSGNLQS